MLKTESISVFGFTKSGLFRYLDLDKVVKSDTIEWKEVHGLYSDNFPSLSISEDKNYPIQILIDMNLNRLGYDNDAWTIRNVLASLSLINKGDLEKIKSMGDLDEKIFHKTIIEHFSNYFNQKNKRALETIAHDCAFYDVYYIWELLLIDRKTFHSMFISSCREEYLPFVNETLKEFGIQADIENRRFVYSKLVQLEYELNKVIDARQSYINSKEDHLNQAQACDHEIGECEKKEEKIKSAIRRIQSKQKKDN